MNFVNSPSHQWESKGSKNTALSVESTQLSLEVAQRVANVDFLVWKGANIIPGSEKFIKTIINGWYTPHVKTYLRNILSRDSLLGDIFEVNLLGIQVKATSRVLEAHFGDIISDTGKKLNLQVVPGVILKRLVSSIFGVNFYSSTELPPVSVIFKSGITPRSALSFKLTESSDHSDSKIPELSLFTEVNDKKKLALTILGGESLSSETFAELRWAAPRIRAEEANFSPTDSLEYLAQWGDLRLALNTGVVDPEKKIYQTIFGYPRQLNTQAILEHRSPAIAFVRNTNGDYEVPWEILEEAVCQAATLAVQKYIFAPMNKSHDMSSIKKEVLTEDTLIVLSRSTSQIHRSALMSEREFLKITLKVTMWEWDKIDAIEYIVTPKIPSQEIDVIMSWTIYGTRISKTMLARALRV